MAGPLKRFAYYEALGAESKRTYRKSDALLRVAVPDIESLVPLAKAVEPALAAANRAAVERACQQLVDGLNARLATPSCTMRSVSRNLPGGLGGAGVRMGRVGCIRNP